MIWILIFLAFMGCDGRLVKKDDMEDIRKAQATAAADRAYFVKRLSEMEAKIGPVVDRLNDQNKSLKDLTTVIKDRLPSTSIITPTPTPTTGLPSFSFTPLMGGSR